MTCQECRTLLEEVSLQEALKFTQTKALRTQISGQDTKELPDAYKQYHIRSYLKDHSLFLDFDLYKNRLKHGRLLGNFFIAPVNFTVLFNIPWFLFNVLSSNLFHMYYTEYCQRCDSKYIKGHHTKEECDYNIEYFSMLNDILKGNIVDRKEIYEQYSKEKRQKGLKSAYRDLFCRRVRWEAFWDIISIGLSIAFWLYIAIYVSRPMGKVLMQKLQYIETYEWSFTLPLTVK